MIPAVDVLLSGVSRGGLSRRQLATIILAVGPIYGMAMGSFALDAPERLRLMVFVAAKMPLLVFATSLVCVPGFFVLNSLAGLRADFSRACGAILSGQAALTLSLASLAPLTRFVYFCDVTHRGALLVNAGMFTIATAAGQVVMIRRYRELIGRSPRHRFMLAAWVVMYAFVGMQMGWMLRPFVGTPGAPVTFFRDEPFSNAYIVIIELIFG